MWILDGKQFLNKKRGLKMGLYGIANFKMWMSGRKNVSEVGWGRIAREVEGKQSQLSRRGGQ